MQAQSRSFEQVCLTARRAVSWRLAIGALLIAAGQASAAVSSLRQSATPTAETVVTAKRPTLPRPRAVLFAVPPAPKPVQSLVVEKPRERPMTALEYAASLRSPLSQLHISSRFGARMHPVKKKEGFHYGVDYVAAIGTPVRAAQDGVVTALGNRPFYGNQVRIDHGHGVQTVYGHLLKFMPGLKAGSIVRAGTLIGFVGATGRATGAHLHFEVLANGKPVDPLRLTMAFAPDYLLTMR